MPQFGDVFQQGIAKSNLNRGEIEGKQIEATFPQHIKSLCSLNHCGVLNFLAKSVVVCSPPLGLAI
jgi:hypothetical protein